MNGRAKASPTLPRSGPWEVQVFLFFRVSASSSGWVDTAQQSHITLLHDGSVQGEGPPALRSDGKWKGGKLEAKKMPSAQFPQGSLARTGHSPLPKAITWQEKWISHEESKHIIGRKIGVRKANTLTLKPQWDHHGLEMRGSQPQTHLKLLRELWKHGANDALQQSTWLWISGGVGSSFR